MARWHRLAPDEVSVNATDPGFGHVWTQKDDGSDADSKLWFYGDRMDDWASILAGVVYHASRREINLCLYTEAEPYAQTKRGRATAATDGRWTPTRHKRKAEARCERGQPGAMVRALALASLTAYLDALEAV